MVTSEKKIQIHGYSWTKGNKKAFMYNTMSADHRQTGTESVKRLDGTFCLVNFRFVSSFRRHPRKEEQNAYSCRQCQN